MDRNGAGSKTFSLYQQDTDIIEQARIDMNLNGPSDTLQQIVRRYPGLVAEVARLTEENAKLKIALEKAKRGL